MSAATDKARLEQAERVIRQLVDIHALETRALADDYNAVRRVRRDGRKVWEEARLWLAGCADAAK